MAGRLREAEYRFVYRTDIRGYYRHIRKASVLSLAEHYASTPALRSLLVQYAGYSVEDGGEIHTPQTGICRRCALSPMVGAAVLYHVDGHFNGQSGVYYARYMDDFLFFTRNRHQLRRCVRELYGFFAESGFERHPDKTQLGRAEQGFDWLGLWFNVDGTTIAPRAVENYQQKRQRLYEQLRTRGLSAENLRERMLAYDARWKVWADSMVTATMPEALQPIIKNECNP